MTDDTFETERRRRAEGDEALEGAWVEYTLRTPRRFDPVLVCLSLATASGLVAFVSTVIKAFLE